jgi:two-component system sensor histidine kinase RegB
VVRLPRTALLQVAHSLLMNAFDASTADGQVGVSVEASDEVLKIQIRDEGRGMPAELLARVGEPFFSTKAPGQGLGLGLFIARTLSEQMGGHLTVESRVGQGTTALVEIGGLGRRAMEPRVS